jgi:hypothetical protein
MTRWIWALLIPLAGPAQAHDWYAPNCCSGHDCHPLEDSEVKELPQGWGTPSGVVGYQDKRVKPSQDGRFHICVVEIDASPYMFSPKGRRTSFTSIRCLYVPPRGT